jgi:hypothetical protein
MKSFTATDVRRKTRTALFILTLCVFVSEGAAGFAANIHATDGVAKDGEAEVTLTLSADGFAPAQVTRPAGRFMLSVDNRTDVKALTLRLSDAGGTVVREIKVREGALDWSEEINLAAGQYTLMEASHSQWVCQLTIQ